LITVTLGRLTGCRQILSAVVVLVLLSGCATGPQWPEPEDHEHVHPDARLLVDVPFHAQERYQCGPASLAMMLNARAIEVTPDELVDRVYLPERGGTLQVELVSAARERGLLVYPLRTEVDAVIDEVAAGNPVLVMQNLRFSWWPQWHYAVVVGYDRRSEELILHSGLEEHYRQPLRMFMATWDRADRWALVMMDPGHKPATAEPLPFLRAAHDLESTGQLKAAYRAYDTAREAWPEEPAAHFGLGNVASTLGQNEASVVHFMTLTQAHPEIAAGWNNLGIMLSRIGCPVAADAALNCAAERDERFRASQPESAPPAPPGTCPLLECPTPE